MMIDRTNSMIGQKWPGRESAAGAARSRTSVRNTDSEDGDAPLSLNTQTEDGDKRCI